MCANTFIRTLSKIAFDGIKQQKLVFYKHELPEDFRHMGFMSEGTVCGQRCRIKLQLSPSQPSRVPCRLACLTVTRYKTKTLVSS